ncbi:MAG TPA: DUF2207 domain-containing protein [Fusobacterium sp.]|uniref:DUF2207 family protein n=1 Tax=Fusobacterium sp. TaxID=68766 RepID=UPI002F42B6A5
MKKIISLLLFTYFHFALLSADFEIIHLDIQAKLEENASLKVREELSYRVGEINGILFDLDAKGNGPLTALSVYASDEEGKFQQIPQSDLEITEEDELYHIKVYARTENQLRKFAFVYELQGGAKLYQDIAELNRVFVGKNWQSPIEKVQVRISLPDAVPPDSIHAYGHGPLTGNIKLNANTVYYELDDYYPGDFVEAHILFGPQGLSQIPDFLKISGNAKERLLAEEKALAEKANSQREQYQKLEKQGYFVFAMELFLLAVYFFFVKFILRKAKKVSQELPEYFRELPADDSPAIVGNLFQIEDSVKMFATIMDLVRRNYFHLEVQEKEQILHKTSYEKNTVSLKPYEQEIMELYLHQLGDGIQVNLSQIAKQKFSKSLSQRMLGWNSLVKREYFAKGYGNSKSPLVILGVLCCFLLLLMSIASFVFFQQIQFLFLAPMIFVCFLPYTLNSTFPNPKTAESIEKWKAFKKFLEDYSLLQEAKITSIYLWEHYFVYALVLGVADKVAKAYQFALEKGEISLPEGRNSLPYTPCLHSYIRQPKLQQQIQKTYQRSYQSIARSSSSSIMGKGGGFSGGSSGGGGSRGGGGAF